MSTIEMRTLTSLQWTYKEASSMTWEKAMTYCAKLNYGGHNDWRLPNLDELTGLIGSDIPNDKRSLQWTSSSCDGADKVFAVDFTSGGLTACENLVYIHCKFRCVRRTSCPKP